MNYNKVEGFRLLLFPGNISVSRSRDLLLANSNIEIGLIPTVTRFWVVDTRLHPVKNLNLTYNSFVGHILQRLKPPCRGQKNNNCE